MRVDDDAPLGFEGEAEAPDFATTAEVHWKHSVTD
jgi:hypothetical protein